MTAALIQLPEGVPPLTTFYVYLTEGCNLACRHCWLAPAYQPNGGTGGHLDYDLLALAIDEALPLGLSHVKLTGGEPLLHPEFVRIVDLLKEKNLGITIETNGTLMTAELARYLREKSTLSFISVSLDGATAESHDPFRGVKGSFERACQGIRCLVEVGYHPQVIMSLHHGNVSEMSDLVRLAEQMGAGSVKFNLIQSTGRGELMSVRGQTLDITHLVDLGRWVETDLQKKTPIPLFYSWPMVFYSLKRLQIYGTDSCGIYNIMGVLPGGQFAMCGIGQAIHELCYGRIGESPLADIWLNHPMLQALRQNVPGELEGICADCVFRDQCLGSCIAQNYHEAQKLTAPFWFCQQARETGLFPVSRLTSQ
jgi:SynChlorMet cassette radical SAM/SPASM protein ScmF